MKYAKQAREKYFEDEADVSGSASEDERDMSQELSGDFINDGEYTDDDDAGAYTQQAMYYRLNHLDEESPVLNFKFKGAERGLPIIERLVKKQKIEIAESPMDESFISYENDSIIDSNHEMSPSVYSVCSDDVTSAKKIGIDDGSKKSTVSRVIHKQPLASSDENFEYIAQTNDNVRVINQSLPYIRKPLSDINNGRVIKPVKYKAPLESQDQDNFVEFSSSIKPANTTTTTKVNNFANNYDLNSINDDDDW